MTYYEPKDERIERERIVLDLVRNNPNLHHNALLRLVVPEFMAKTTFEKTKNTLLERNLLTLEQIGNMKFYRATENYKIKSSQHMERISHENFQTLQHEIKRTNEDFHHKDVTEKISLSVRLLRGLLQTDNSFTILDSTKNPKKTLYKDEHQTIQEMISKVFEVITNDKDFELVYPTVMSYLEDSISKSNQEIK
jgi:hypothetical protein